jgi:hypothetical protein
MIKDTFFARTGKGHGEEWNKDKQIALPFLLTFVFASPPIRPNRNLGVQLVLARQVVDAEK